MSHTWVNFQYLSDEEFKLQTEARAAKQKKVVAQDVRR
jgi:hypothetical protein